MLNDAMLCELAYIIGIHTVIQITGRAKGLLLIGRWVIDEIQYDLNSRACQILPVAWHR